MELREYWRIFARRWWLAVGMALLVAAVSLVVGARVRATYSATIRVLVSVAPESPTGAFFTYDKYYTFLSTEYLVDDLSEFVKSRVFADAVRQQTGDPSIDAAAIQEASRPKKTHRVLAVTVTTADSSRTQRIAEAIGVVLERQAPEYVLQLSAKDVSVRLIDPPSVAPSAGGLRNVVDLAMRTVLGFVAGLGLILLSEYLDSSVRDSGEAERLLGVPVLGEIPRGG